MALVGFITLGIIVFAMVIPVFTVAGYMRIEDEPKRHEVSSKLIPIPFLLLAIINFTDDNYIQMGAALVVAFLMFFVFRKAYDQEERLEGRYVQIFLYLTAVYFALGIDFNNITVGAIVSSLAIAAMIGGLAYFLPIILRELAPIGGNYNAPSLSGPGGRDLYAAENTREVSHESIDGIKEMNRSINNAPAQAPLQTPHEESQQRERFVPANPSSTPQQVSPLPNQDPQVAQLGLTPSVDLNALPISSSNQVEEEPVSQPEIPVVAPPVNKQTPPPEQPLKDISPAIRTRASVEAAEQAEREAVKKRSYKPNDIFEIVGGEVPKSELEPVYNPNALDEDSDDPQLKLLKQLKDNKQGEGNQVKSKIDVPDLPTNRMDQQSALEMNIDKESIKTTQPKVPTSGFKFHLNKEPEEE